MVFVKSFFFFLLGILSKRAIANAATAAIAITVASNTSSTFIYSKILGTVTRILPDGRPALPRARLRQPRMANYGTPPVPVPASPPQTAVQRLVPAAVRAHPFVGLLA